MEPFSSTLVPLPYRLEAHYIDFTVYGVKIVNAF